MDSGELIDLNGADAPQGGYMTRSVPPPGGAVWNNSSVVRPGPGRVCSRKDGGVNVSGFSYCYSGNFRNFGSAVMPKPGSGWMVGGYVISREDFSVDISSVDFSMTQDGYGGIGSALQAFMNSFSSYRMYACPVVALNSYGNAKVIDYGPFYIEIDPPPGSIMLWPHQQSVPYGWEDVTPGSGAYFIKFSSGSGFTTVGSDDATKKILIETRGTFPAALPGDGDYAVRVIYRMEHDYGGLRYYSVRLIKRK